MVSRKPWKQVFYSSGSLLFVWCLAINPCGSLASDGIYSYQCCTGCKLVRWSGSQSVSVSQTSFFKVTTTVTTTDTVYLGTQEIVLWPPRSAGCPVNPIFHAYGLPWHCFRRYFRRDYSSGCDFPWVLLHWPAPRTHFWHHQPRTEGKHPM